jgi:diaminohydroxyphosphoribosylaminopyrimidine deaminase/5-amino-6-(5-phosphoribosylamino)uracil reductase
LDPNPKVSGTGVQRLRDAGLEVTLAHDPEPFKQLNRFFFLNQSAKRPFVLLKWAETPNGFIGKKVGERALLSCTEANRYVHRLRSTYQAILVGRTTARLDDPRLSVRLYPGVAPIRLVFDYDCNLSPDLNLFRGSAPLILINHKRDEALSETVRYFKPQRNEAFMDLKVLLEEIYERFSIGSVLVEGGRYVLQQFINQHLFDEIQVIRTPEIIRELDVPAPVLPYQFYFDSYSPLGRDLLLTRTMPL